MKTAKAYPITVDVICPHCNEPVENNNNSLMWEITEVVPRKEFDCSECGKTFQLPQRINQPYLLRNES